MLDRLREDVKKLSDSERAKNLQRFFKTGKGEYGEGDMFVGITVPQLRILARRYKDLPLSELGKLLSSKIHEERLVALLLLVENFKKGDMTEKEEIFDFYLSHSKYINNWDLVDLSAGYIVGGWLLASKDNETKVLEQLAKSRNLWERRIAMIATFACIYVGQDKPTYTVAALLVTDTHDLIQKAVGWMLREAGKRVSLDNEEAFLKTHYKQMGRTALRYAIERFPESKRKAYLHGEI